MKNTGFSPFGAGYRLEKPVLKKKTFSILLRRPRPGPVPRAQARAPAKKDGKFKFTARKPAKKS